MGISLSGVSMLFCAPYTDDLYNYFRPAGNNAIEDPFASVSVQALLDQRAVFALSEGKWNAFSDEAVGGVLSGPGGGTEEKEHSQWRRQLLFAARLLIHSLRLFCRFS